MVLQLGRWPPQPTVAIWDWRVWTWDLKSICLADATKFSQTSCALTRKACVCLITEVMRSRSKAKPFINLGRPIS